MIVLLHNVAVLGLQADTGRLFDGDDVYQLALELTCEMVAATNDQR